MLSPSQIKLLKMAQRQAGIEDAEYREIIHHNFDVLSSTDPRLGDDAFDVLLAMFEAIYWRGVDAGRLQQPCNGNAPFRQRGYWAAKNKAGNTSRDRYTGQNLETEIETAEAGLYRVGCSLSYVAAIRNRVCRGRYTPPQQRAYLAALQRTLKARRKKQVKPDAPPVSAPAEDPVW